MKGMPDFKPPGSKDSAFMRISRRQFLQRSGYVIGISCVMPYAMAQTGVKSEYGPLQEADANGIRLPKGFSSRVIARSGDIVSSANFYRWHNAPDGGACFAADDGGWIYVSNSEVDRHQGGVSALRFNKRGDVVDAYPILKGSSRNCSGGATPWGTWLSCEEIDRGQVWECDPRGQKKAQACPALGRFSHEAAAVDTDTFEIYLTEDKPDGRLYRFRAGKRHADDHPDLSSGILEVAQMVMDNGFRLQWHPIPDPAATARPTRYQVKSSSAFNGGEGICYHHGIIYFATKGDSRVWAFDTRDRRIRVLYDDHHFPSPILTGVDNVIVSPRGDLLVSEDGGDMQIIVLTKAGKPAPLIQIVGQDRSEVTGLAFSPDNNRLYFSSQRGPSGKADGGITYEVKGPFK